VWVGVRVCVWVGVRVCMCACECVCVRARVCLKLHRHHHNNFSINIEMGGDESRFHVSFTVSGKTEKGEPKRGMEPTPSVYQPITPYRQAKPAHFKSSRHKPVSTAAKLPASLSPRPACPEQQIHTSTSSSSSQ